MSRYLAYLDGTSFSDRLFWLLLTDSLVFRAGSSIRVWLDAGLEAWKHYVPVQGNWSEARMLYDPMVCHSKSQLFVGHCFWSNSRQLAVYCNEWIIQDQRQAVLQKIRMSNTLAALGNIGNSLWKSNSDLICSQVCVLPINHVNGQYVAHNFSVVKTCHIFYRGDSPALPSPRISWISLIGPNSTMRTVRSAWLCFISRNTDTSICYRNQRNWFNNSV